VLEHAVSNTAALLIKPVAGKLSDKRNKTKSFLSVLSGDNLNKKQCVFNAV
jgi:hypothetical protein